MKKPNPDMSDSAKAIFAKYGLDRHVGDQPDLSPEEDEILDRVIDERARKAAAEEAAKPPPKP
jgi:hypothetical protein